MRPLFADKTTSTPRLWQHSGMAISFPEYISAVRVDVPEAREFVDRLAEDYKDIGLVAQINIGLTHLLLWSWRSGDQETCARILGVMERGLVDTDEDDYAPVWNTVGIGVVETVAHDLAPDDFAAFVESWPPALRERGLLQTTWDDECCEEGPESFRPPFSRRVRCALRHPVNSRHGRRGLYAG